jgi:GNAT superfamily N-acetyltransferase
MKIFSHEVVQRQWASIDYRKNMSILGLVRKGGHKEIVAIGSYAEDDMDRVEVAFVVRENYQRMGIASYLLDMLERIAEENGYTGFSASALRENKGMLQVFRNRYPNAISNNRGTEVNILMDFADAVKANADQPPAD